MKTNPIFNTVLVIFAAFLMAACGQSGNGDRIARSTNGVAGTGTVTTSATNACGSAAGALGRVFDDASMTSTGASFENRVKGLISADYDPQYIGTIEGINGPSKTCVTLQGSLVFNSAGQVNIDQSSLSIKVYDSYAEKLDTDGKPAGAFPINFAKATSGQRDGNGMFTVTFADTLGSVTVTGQVVQNQVVGTITYSNLQNASGGAGASGPLGAFAINTSSFLK